MSINTGHQLVPFLITSNNALLGFEDHDSITFTRSFNELSEIMRGHGINYTALFLACNGIQYQSVLGGIINHQISRVRETSFFRLVLGMGHYGSFP